MSNARHRALLIAGLILTAALVGCSSNNNSNLMGGGGREFVSGDLPSGQSFTHVFKTAMVVPYYCRYHGGAGGVGMSGVITVVAGGTPTKHTFTITDMTLPTMTINVMDTMTWTNSSGLLHTVESDH